jgi:hypothetical protein
MSELKNFIIYGVGRCGSHWVESIIIDLCGSVSKSLPSGVNNLIHLLPTGWIVHTHDVDVINCNNPIEVQESTWLISCYRENKFEQAISYFVAQKTNEWFVYSDAEFTPFIVDLIEFEKTLTGLLLSDKALPANNLPLLWPNFVEIKYEDLVNSEIPEKYMAECLGLTYKQTQGWAQHGSKKNPRNYQKLILNWDKLLEIHEKICGIKTTVDQ